MLSIPLYVHERLLKETTEQQTTEITQLKSILETIRSANKRLEKQIKSYARSAQFYDMIQTAIQDDPMLQDAWVNFIATLKLRLEKPVPGLTAPE